MRKLFWIVMCVFACAASQGAEDAKLLMHLPFDGSAVASRSAGDAKPIEEEGLVYGPGLNGQAVEIKKGSKLTYARKGNLRQEEGSVSMWFKPNWSTSDQPQMTLNKEIWYCFFAEPRPTRNRNGSGALWFWLWGNRLRGDISDTNDSYKCASVPFEKGDWHHLVFSWNAKGQVIYCDGKRVTSGQHGDGNNALKALRGKGGAFKFDPERFDRFFVGNHKGIEQAKGWIDEFKIYDGMLSDEQIANEFAQLLPVELVVDTPYLLPSSGKAGWSIKHRGGKGNVNEKYTVTITDPNGKKVFDKTLTVRLAPGEKKEFDASVSAGVTGQYKIKLASDKIAHRMGALSDSFFVLKEKNELVGEFGDNPKTTPVLSIHVPDYVGTDKYVDYGDTHKAELNGTEYLEAGSGRNDRFAIHLTLPEADIPYWVEWTYPDDKRRTIDVVAQTAKDGGSEYMYHTGVFCGDEYDNSGKMQTFRSVYWAKSTDIAFIFMTARKGAPAAVADLRISKIEGGLPQALVQDAEPINDWTRPFGIYFEDPAVSYDFGANSGMMPEYEKTLDRMMAYMKWTGQNFFAYPGVWYHGMIGGADNYMPREHARDFIRIILTKFEAQGMTFMPTINLHTIPLADDIRLDPAAYKDGSLHSTPVMIRKDGRPNPGGFHGSPPLFNPLHPATKKCINKYVDDLLDRYADSPAFKGVILHLTKHTIPWFGTIEAGYNDYNIEQFEKDTGIKVPVDRKLAERGKLYYEWLMANAKAQWIDWRCKKISEWYLDIARRVKARRSDLKLGLFSYNPVMTSVFADDRFGTPGSSMQFNLESGLNPKYYENADNVIICQTVYPADYRWSEGKRYHVQNPERRELERRIYTKKFPYSILENADFTFVNMHDRYFEDAIGRLKKGQTHWSAKVAKPLEAPWLQETGWRVSTLNPGTKYFLEQFIMPLRHNDVMGFSKGGFLVGTLGMESKLREFAAAYRPLPAKKFSDVYGVGGDVTVRSLKHNGSAWFYVVNSSRKPVEITVGLSGNVAKIEDLASGADVLVKGGAVKLEISDYMLRSFKIKGDVDITVSEK